MSPEELIKTLGRETKALIVVNEFEARRMPMFQLRSILNVLVANEEEKKIIIDLVENDLKATGYHPNQVTAFLQDLLNEEPVSAPQTLQVTRRLRSPFSRSFESAPPAQAPAPLPAAQPPVAPTALPGYSIRPAGQPAGGTAAYTMPNAPVKMPPAGSTPVRQTGVGLPAVNPPTQPQGQRVAPIRPPSNVAAPKVPLSTGPVTGNPNASHGTSKPGDAMFFGSGAGVEVATKPKVLLADDDKRIRIVFRMCLERLGCQVVEVEDGNEAWKILQEDAFSMVVLDMKMPGLHGLEVLTRMTAKQIHTPVIVCSAYDNLKDEFVVATRKNLKYLVKPVAAESLDSAARELLNMPAE